MTHEAKSLKRGKTDVSDTENSGRNKVVKNAIAWVVLIVVGIMVWKMAAPVLPKKPHENIANEATETASNPAGSEKSTKDKNSSNKGTGNISLPSGADRVQVIASALNVRAEPDLKSDKVTVLSKGTVVQVLGRSGQWIKIKTAQGDVGYIKASPELIRAAP